MGSPEDRPGVGGDVTRDPAAHCGRLQAFGRLVELADITQERALDFQEKGIAGRDGERALDHLFGLIVVADDAQTVRKICEDLGALVRSKVGRQRLGCDAAPLKPLDGLGQSQAEAVFSDGEKPARNRLVSQAEARGRQAGKGLNG